MQITEAPLDAHTEWRLARTVEVGLFAQHLLHTGASSGGVRYHEADLQAVVDEGREAWQRLWLANAGMVKMVARRYSRGDPALMDDLVQEGWVALAEALMRYDYTRGLRLSTHAWHWLRHGMAARMRQQTGWEKRTRGPVDPIDESGQQQLAHNADGGDLHGVLAGLTTLERRVLLARAQGRTLAAIGAELGLTVSSIRRVSARASARAREAYLRHPPAA
ncbi:sigma-70 family RNA polymerase sigma factor [Propionibacteriaceae bacterium G57]|uniref:sigma-70 family RNA polymerase sigma factor n=1 Tax=Aestuariimicrobium sp. G57 TaxID=3418485 RepID=UPI003DA6F9D2